MEDLHLQRQPNKLKSKGRHALPHRPLKTKRHSDYLLMTEELREENAEEDMQVRN